eukprot:CAMPEP_0176269192 /NCGR_PEP_ID=MMETSP0121_2-20121125/44066_1 /TAXON_ID=160619 /ORGANISM="Kryptoperidinium foliaceum, Strain CCMP 1326" /LENGTH=113 /DNA_ID=CAMNT_0017609315 /DNA_START=45 /DNA_END=383 /DNA_ORIENTATION=+
MAALLTTPLPKADVDEDDLSTVCGSEAAGAEEESSEEELTAEVPQLLEAMNRAAGELNDLELAGSAARRRHREHLAAWRRRYEELLAEYGAKALDRASALLSADDAMGAAEAR